MLGGKYYIDSEMFFELFEGHDFPHFDVGRVMLFEQLSCRPENDFAGLGYFLMNFGQIRFAAVFDPPIQGVGYNEDETLFE